MDWNITVDSKYQDSSYPVKLCYRFQVQDSEALKFIQDNCK